MLGALAMSLSSLFVVTNALRLNFFKAEKSEQLKDYKIIKIKGMMCNHCEQRVITAIFSLPYIKSAVANYKKGIVTISFEKEFSEKEIKEVIEKQGYKVLKIK